MALLNATHAKVTWDSGADHYPDSDDIIETDLRRTHGYQVRVNLKGRADHLGSRVILTQGAAKRSIVVSLCSLSTPEDCCFPWKDVIYAEVMAVPTIVASTDEGWKPSEWSANSLTWSVASDCKEHEYLRTGNMMMSVTNWTCATCPTGSSCAEREVWDGGIGQRGIQPLFGWWKCNGMASDDPAGYTKCERSTVCLGAFNPNVPIALQQEFKQWQHGDPNNRFQQLCHPDRLNPAENNIRCSTCNASLGLMNDLGSCNKCDPVAATALFTFVLLLVVGLFCILIVLKMRSSGRKKAVHSTIKRLILNHLQVATVVMSLKVPWPSAVRSTIVSLGDTAGLSSYGDFLRCARNEIGNINTRAGSFYFNLVMMSMSIVMVILVSGVYWIQCVPRCPRSAAFCMRAKNDHFKRSTCFPFSANIAEGEGNRKGGGKGKKKKTKIQRSTRDGWVVTIVYYIYCLYPNLIRQSFMAFECVEVCGTLTLAIDDTELCYGNTRHTTMVFAVALPILLLFGVLCPLLALVFLWSKRKSLMTSQILIFRFGLLYSGYAYSRWWWECMTLGRKILMITIVTFEPSDGTQVHLALGLLIVLLYVQERGRPYDNHQAIAEEKKRLTLKKKSTATEMERRRSSAHLYNMKKSAENIEHAPLHLLEVMSFLLLITMMWFAVFFLNNPPAIDGECVSITEKSLCVGNNNLASGGGGDGGGGSSGQGGGRGGASGTAMIKTDVPSCSWDDAGQVCYVRGGAFNNFLAIILLFWNIFYLLACIYYFAKGFVTRNQGVQRKLDKVANSLRHAARFSSVRLKELVRGDSTDADFAEGDGLEVGAEGDAEGGVELSPMERFTKAKIEAGFQIVENPLRNVENGFSR